MDWKIEKEKKEGGRW